MQISIKFPFRIQQIDDNCIVVSQGEGLPFPGLCVSGAEADKFLARFGIAPEKHDAILDELQDLYMGKIVRELVTVEVVPDGR